MKAGLKTVKTICVVEDDPVIAELVRWRIENLGYVVCSTASTGEEAVEYCRQNPPDLVLMDIGLAGRIDGIDAAMAIKKQCRLPVVFLSARTDEDCLARVKQVRPDGFIRKPFDDDDLRITLKLLL